MIFLDEISFIIFIICFVSYFLLLYLGFKLKKPSKFNVFKKIYGNWVKERLNEESQLVAVQSLRNFIMGNSTFVSALFILLGIIFGFYNFFAMDGKNFWNIRSISTGLVQFTLILFLLMFCLINFILSIRYSS
jgi:uncharacterized membrane protein